MMKRAKDDQDTKFSFQNGAVTESSVRTTGRVKKPKTVYDPSDNYVSRAAQRNAAAQQNANAVVTASTNSGASSGHNTTAFSGVGLADTSGTMQNISATSSVSSTSSSSAGQPHGNQSFSLITADSSTSQKSSSTIDEYGKRFDTCSICLKKEIRRGQGFKSNFLTCKSCFKREHIDCLPVEFENLSLARKRFKCKACRACIVCVSHKLSTMVSKSRDLIICIGCLNVYHPECHAPPIQKSKILEHIWKCVDCIIVDEPETEEDNEDIEYTTESEVNTTPKKADDETAKINNNNNNDSPKSNQNEEEHDADTDDDDNIKKNATIAIQEQTVTTLMTQENDEDTIKPTEEEEANAVKATVDEDNKQPKHRITQDIVRQWSVDEVVKFFEKIYPKEAQVFHDHDIDGASLLLLRRSDVIKRFNLRLGPSLRLYEAILTIQVGNNNVQNAWQD